MTVFLIRHAKAGDRDSWRDDDRLRPLSGRGHLQARVLAEIERGQGIRARAALAGAWDAARDRRLRKWL